MTATKTLDMSLPFVLKQENDQNTSINNEDMNDENDSDDSNSSLLQPSILDKCNSFCDHLNNDEFLRLNSTVRRVYFSYLYKSIISNYNTCCRSRELSKAGLKKFASQLELHAVKASLQASLYRQEMLKIISDVKDNTNHKKVHKKLAYFLDIPPTSVDVAVQTCNDHIPIQKNETIDDSTIVSPVQKINIASCFKEEIVTECFNTTQKTFDKESNHDYYENGEITMNNLNEMKLEPLELSKITATIQENNEKNTNDIDKNQDIATSIIYSNNINTNCEEIFGNLNGTEEIQIKAKDDDNSKDSLMQNLENMFCESEDSNDLTSLIDKHTSVVKTNNIDNEISKFCMKTLSNLPSKNTPSQVSKVVQSSTPIKSSNKNVSMNKRKLSIKSYNSMRKKALKEKHGLPVDANNEEIREDKETRKIRGIWFVERVHQVAKLRERMLEISVSNYRKHGRLKEKFAELFGDSDGEESMPESPIHIEEHLTACKERIAPWVVRHLMPFYTYNKIIENRLLFKAVAKHIADMLIIKNTFPEEDCVSQYIKDYFRNKQYIKTESDIYV